MTKFNLYISKIINKNVNLKKNDMSTIFSQHFYNKFYVASCYRLLLVG